MPCLLKLRTQSCNLTVHMNILEYTITIRTHTQHKIMTHEHMILSPGGPFQQYKH